jgi:hypothetical protein
MQLSEDRRAELEREEIAGRRMITVLFVTFLMVAVIGVIALLK